MRDIQSLIQVFRERARSAGMKVTPQRLAIYSELVSRTDHPSAEDIYESLKNKIPGISLATVYRTLSFLEEHGLAVNVATVNGSARFDGNTALHGHLICRKCGKIEDVECSVSVESLVPQSSDFELERCVITCYGLCSSCRRDKK